MKLLRAIGYGILLSQSVLFIHLFIVMNMEGGEVLVHEYNQAIRVFELGMASYGLGFLIYLMWRYR